jgi:ABC-type multidrug transport system fused ATPase/permease subunit
MLHDVRRCLTLLSANLRRQWLGLVPLALLSAGLEMLGAAAIFALIAIIGNPARAAELPVASFVYRRLPWHGDRAVVAAFTGLVMAVYIIRSVVLAAAVWAQEKVMVDSVSQVSSRMFLGYLSAPYDAHLRRDSASIIHRMTDSVDTALRMVLSSAVNIGSELLVIAGVIFVLTMAAPLVTLAAVAAAVALLASSLMLTRRAFATWGSDRHRFEQELIQSVQQGIGAFKEARVAGRARFFHEQFVERQRRVMRARWQSGAASTVLRLGTEAVFVLGMLMTVLLISLRGVSGAAMTPLLGLFAYAGFRIIPSANRIMMNAGNMRLGHAAVDAVHRDAETQAREGTSRPDEPDEPVPDIPFTESIELSHISYTYDGAQHQALDDINLVIRKGEAVGIVGLTGAGKSTLVDVLLGLLEPATGRVLVDGGDIRGRVAGWQRHIGYVPQDPFFLDDTIRRNIQFGHSGLNAGESGDSVQVNHAVRLARLDAMLARLPAGLETIVGERGARLSGGERQRIAIARALYRNSDVLVFDEATSALDNLTASEVAATLMGLKSARTIVVIAHRLSTLQGCDRLAFMQGGRVVDAGPFFELAARNADFRALVAAGVTPETAVVETEIR